MRVATNPFFWGGWTWPAVAELEWGAVVLVGLIAFVGFSLLSYWVSAWMSRRNISGQVKGKPPKAKDAKAPEPASPKAGKA